jgi:hypothetical protein
VARTDDLDDDTVLSALLPIDRTVVSGASMAVDEQTIISGPGGELDEKTRATERRALNTDGGSSGARIAFAPAERRERYRVRAGGTALPTVTRIEIPAPAARAPLRPRRTRDGRYVLAAAVFATVLVAGVVGVILTLVFSR